MGACSELNGFQVEFFTLLSRWRDDLVPTRLINIDQSACDAHTVHRVGDPNPLRQLIYDFCLLLLARWSRLYCWRVIVG
ncbi:MAG: hypothetical protein ACKO96_03220 [Flammeovirgaceae bacterium]